MSTRKNSKPSAKFHRVVYVKNFLTGTLAGLQYRSSYAVDANRCHEVQSGLMYITQDNPAADAMTGVLYYVTGVGCEEIHDGEDVCTYDVLAQEVL